MEGKLYVLFDYINDNLILASFNKQEILAKVGSDYFKNEYIDNYVLKSINVEDLQEED